MSEVTAPQVNTQEAPKVVPAPAATPDTKVSTPEVVSEVKPESKQSRASGFVQNLLAERKKAQDVRRADESKAQESAKQAKVQEAADRLEYLRANAHKDPRLLIQEFNVPNDSLIRANLGTYEPEPLTEEQLFDKRIEERLEKHIAPLREKAAKYDEFIGQSEANQKQQSEVQERLLMDNIKNVSKSEGHEWIEHYGQEAYDTVREVMYAYWEKYGVPLPYSDACARVNESYEERAISLSKTKAFQKFMPKTDPQDIKATATPAATNPKTTVSERVAKSESAITQSPSQLLASGDAAWQEMKKRKLNKK